VTIETLGLALAEGKLILKKVQAAMVQEQVSDALLRLLCCPVCGKVRHSRGHHDVTVRTVFGNVELQSPRLGHCPCQPHAEKTFSPLQTMLPEHVSPELLYLEVKTIRNHLFQVAERLEEELGEERPCLIEGCEQDWEQLPIPDGPLTAGLDGGFVRARHKTRLLRSNRGNERTGVQTRCRR